MHTPLQTILYVEDDDNIAEIASITLEEIGNFKVRRCKSGKEALSLIPDYQPQLILMDVMMPQMDGPETLHHLRKLPEGASIPVVFMTARTQKHEQKAYITLGAIGVITKPFNPLLLCESINRLWEQANVLPHQPASLKEELKEISLLFQKNLLKFLPLYKQLHHHLEHGELKDPIVSDVYYEIHKVAGSASLFGFIALGKSAERLEHIILLHNKTAQTRNLRQALFNELEYFIQEVMRITQETDHS
jgi:CheY-like chemotaxis protein